MRSLPVLLSALALVTACARVPVSDAVTVPPALVPPTADAQFEPWLQAERARLASARAGVQQRFQDDESACWRRFAVNDCVREARARRRAAADALRAQDLALNELERQRRTEARRRQLEGKRKAAD